MAGGQPEDTAAWLNGGIRGGGERGGTGILTSQRTRRWQTCTGNASSVGHPGTTMPGIGVLGRCQRDGGWGARGPCKERLSEVSHACGDTGAGDFRKAAALALPGDHQTLTSHFKSIFSMEITSPSFQDGFKKANGMQNLCAPVRRAMRKTMARTWDTRTPAAGGVGGPLVGALRGSSLEAAPPAPAEPSEEVALADTLTAPSREPPS